MLAITVFRNGSIWTGSVSTHGQGMYFELEMISVRENYQKKSVCRQTDRQTDR